MRLTGGRATNSRWLRRKWAVVAALVVGLLANVVPAAAATRGGQDGSSSQTLTYRIGLTQQLTEARAFNASVGRAVALVDPPANGCDLSGLGGKVTAHYTDGVLSYTESDYYSTINCLPTAADQTMWDLWAMASLNHNTGSIHQGSIDSCAYNPEIACLSVRSVGHYVCPFLVECAGDYWVDSETFMTLPDGWVWVNIPGYCTLLDSRQLSCLIEGGKVNIPARL